MPFGKMWLDKLKTAALQTAGQVIQDKVSPPKLRPYTLIVRLALRSPNKRTLEDATKRVSAQADKVGPTILTLLGLAGKVRVDGIETELKVGR